MTRYWMRIILGALAIFLVGTSIYYAARSGKRRVQAIAESDAPITIPLAFIPFKVDGKDLGTLSRLQILRSSPKQVEAVNFRVKLADSIADERLGQCILLAGENGMNFQVKHIDANATFFCATAKDTVGKNLAPLGSIETQRGNTYVLLSGADALKNFDTACTASNDAAGRLHQRRLRAHGRLHPAGGGIDRQCRRAARRFHPRRGRDARRLRQGGHARHAEPVTAPTPQPGPSKAEGPGKGELSACC